MAEYIEREKLPPKKKRGNYLNADFNAGWNACLNEVNSIPAADVVERKTAKWLKSAWSIRCSECGYDMPFAVRNFCPNCGAKMIGGDNDV